MKKTPGIILLSCMLLVFAACASHPQIEADLEQYLYPVETYLPETFDWRQVTDGIYALDFENPEFPVIYHAVKIDLTMPGLQIVCFPDEDFVKSAVKGDEVKQPFIYHSIRTATFARKYDCTVAINATPFGGRNGKWDFAAKISATRQLVGVHKMPRLLVAPPRERYAGIAFTRHSDGTGDFYTAQVFDSQSQMNLNECDFAFGGFFTVLCDGECREFTVRTHDSRSGAGVSADGLTLYLLVVEGEHAARSEGLSYPQCAEVFKAMGCDDALEFDGGSSSDLCINGKSVLTYSTPCVQGNSFGFATR